MLATAGVAIGLGNIWRFPYMMGRYGGAAFLLLYLGIVLAFGVPVLMAEWALGRATGRGPWGAYRRARLPGAGFWTVLLLVTVVMASSYYGVVIAMVLQAAAVELLGRAASSTLPAQMGYTVATIALACGVLAMGVRGGIERISRVALPIFFLLFLVLIVRSLTLPGAGAGLRELLVPRADAFRGTTALAAMGQAIFSLGVGGTFMVAYGSYMGHDDDIPRGAALTAGADVAAALMAGLVIVPAAVAMGVALDGGPGLLFDVMPRVFALMPGGHAFGVLFYLAVFIVALLSLMAAYEVVVQALGTGLGWSRGRALVAVLIVEAALSIPAWTVGRYIEWSDLIWGTTMQPIGAVLAVVALVWCVGRSVSLQEIRRSTLMPVPGWLILWMRYGIPAGILATLAYGWYDTVAR